MRGQGGAWIRVTVSAEALDNCSTIAKAYAQLTEMYFSFNLLDSKPTKGFWGKSLKLFEQMPHFWGVYLSQKPLLALFCCVIVYSIIKS